MCSVVIFVYCISVTFSRTALIQPGVPGSYIAICNHDHHDAIWCRAECCSSIGRYASITCNNGRSFFGKPRRLKNAEIQVGFWNENLNFGASQDKMKKKIDYLLIIHISGSFTTLIFLFKL